MQQLDDNDFEVVAAKLAELYAELKAKNPRAPFTKHEGGATVYCSFVNGDGEATRYRYDMVLCPRSEGWKQYDTDQDAHYFGVWYHMERRVVVTYAEGDETVVICRTAEAWKAELAEMAKFYGDPPPAFVSLDTEAGTITNHYDADARPVLA